MEVYTIGFTKKTAEEFFETLKRTGIKLLVDVRLNNSSQLAGFTKRNDLAYFLMELCGAKYLHEPLLAPAKDIIDAYKKDGGSWEEYERKFLGLMEERKVEDKIGQDQFAAPSVLLCSEPVAQKCHRRLVAEYLRDKWGNLTIVHL